MKKSGRCTRMLNSIDIFGKKTEFQIDQKPKFATTSGGIFTLIYAGLIIFLFFSFGGAMIYKIDPETTVSQIIQPSPSPTIISKDDYFFVFGLQDSNDSHFIDEEIYSAELFLNSKKTETGPIKIPLEPCSLENLPHNPKLSQYFQRQANSLQDLYCISRDYDHKIVIQGAWDQPEFDMLQIYITPCDKSQRVCKSDEEIKEKLKSSFFAIYSTDHLLDLMDYENPAKKIGRDYFIQTSYNLKKIITTYLKTNHIFSDDGWIAKTESQSEYFSFDSQAESSEVLEKFDHLIDFVIRKSYYETNWSRKYKKIQNVLAEMTGFLKIIFFVLSIFSKPFIKKEYFESLTNSIYNFELDEEEFNKIQLRKKKKMQTMDKGEKLKIFQNIQQETERGKERNVEEIRLDKEKQKSLDKNLMNYFFKLKESPLNLSFSELAKSLFVRATAIQIKKNQRKTGINNILAQLDIKFILKKFAEIDKLKMLLLNHDQYHLFEYLPKPVILKNSKIHINYGKTPISNPLVPRKTKENEIILYNDVLTKANVVQKAYENIINQENMNDIDKKLIESLDDEIVRLLKGTNISLPHEETKNVLLQICLTEQKI